LFSHCPKECLPITDTITYLIGYYYYLKGKLFNLLPFLHLNLATQIPSWSVMTHGQKVPLLEVCAIDFFVSMKLKTINMHQCHHRFQAMSRADSSGMDKRWTLSL
jgi:hypothetical protein